MIYFVKAISLVSNLLKPKNKDYMTKVIKKKKKKIDMTKENTYTQRPKLMPLPFNLSWELRKVYHESYIFYTLQELCLYVLFYYLENIIKKAFVYTL